MIEENVAIICACLPMCRIVLAWIFPKAFSSPSTAASGGDASTGPAYTIGSAPKRLSRSQSDDDWHPYSGPNKREGHNQSMARHHPEDSNSEEFILQSVNKPTAAFEMDGAIRKTTHYEISYERDSYNKV